MFLKYFNWKNAKMFPSRYKIYTNLQKSILLEINVNFNFEGSKDVMTSAESKVFGLPGPKKTCPPGTRYVFPAASGKV